MSPSDTGASVRRCIACDAVGPFSAFFEQDGFRLVRCNCGLVFQDPQPDQEGVDSTYYHNPAFTDALMGELRATTLKNARNKVRLLRSSKIDIAGSRILDVGASSGAWLEVAASEGGHATGVELGAATAANARSRGLDVRTGTLESAMATLGDERFDLITFWDVLEHLPDPRHELSLARSLLAPDGVIAVTFPNVEGLYPQLTYRLLATRSGIWEYPELPAHLFDFAPRTARAFFSRHGYRVQRIRTFATPYQFYRSTSLSPERLIGKRGRALRAAFDALHLIAYPVARLSDRGNSMFVVARVDGGRDAPS